jgi:rSAM/selenodomain-associated transferase 1
VLPQVEGDLGQRMAAFFSAQFQAGAAKVVLVGTDSPTLPLSFIAQAFQQLDRAELVLGPATDGGYYLIGCKEPLPPIFKGIAWGTSAVLGETVGRLPDSRWQLALLPPWYDVDTVADWQMLRGHLAALRRAGVDPGLPHTEALIAEG